MRNVTNNFMSFKNSIVVNLSDILEASYNQCWFPQFFLQFQIEVYTKLSWYTAHGNVTKESALLKKCDLKI